MLKTKTIEINPDFKKAVDNNDGYCPCEIWKNEDTKCMCKAFRDQEIGKCNCGRFEKVRVDE